MAAGNGLRDINTPPSPRPPKRTRWAAETRPACSLFFLERNTVERAGTSRKDSTKKNYNEGTAQPQELWESGQLARLFAGATRTLRSRLMKALGNG
jgi:hypothetical protein